MLEFTSARRRQSVLVRRSGATPGAGAELLTKGADAALERLLAPGAGRTHWAATLGHLQTFGASGLRTLCVASRWVDEGEGVAGRAGRRQADGAWV